MLKFTHARRLEAAPDPVGDLHQDAYVSALMNSEPAPLGIGPAQRDGDSTSCHTVQGMFAVGAGRLTDAALQEMAEHLEICRPCSNIFHDLIGEQEEPHEDDPASTARWRELLARFVEQVVAEAAGNQAPHLTIARRANEATSRTPVDLEVQLAPAQTLTGQHSEFVVERRIGCSEFIETYLAEVRPLSRDNEAMEGRRVVIKIPRISIEMSLGAATERLGLIRDLIRTYVQRLQSLAGIQTVAQMIDCGEYRHWFEGGSAESTFVVYEFIRGRELSEYMERRYARAGHFRGLPTASIFAHWARMLTKAVADIHSRLVLHGDICPRNILVTDDERPVFIDVGQSLFREVMNGTPSLSGSLYRAPDGVGAPTSDLFSLGGLLFFLATGREPTDFPYTDREVLKRQIALRVKEANPELYQDDAGVTDVIAACLRREGRVQHAARLLSDIDTFWPEAEPARVLDELGSLTEPVSVLDDEHRCNGVFRAVAVSQIRSLRRVFTDMGEGILDATGSPTDIRSAAYALLQTLSEGDEFVTVSIPAFWFPENIGINGRFLSMCRNAAGRGASVKRVLLINSDLSDPHLEEIVSAQLNAAADLESSQRTNFSVRYVPMTDTRRRTLVANGRHFGLIVKAGDRVAMFPVYDSNDRLVTLRFRSGARQVDGLRESFETVWKQGQSLVDLHFPTRLDIIERLGPPS